MYLPVSRQWSRRIALVFIVFGILLMTPPGTTPDDFLNFILGAHLANHLNMDYTQAVIFTYFLGFPIFLLGLLIYPYNTKRLLISYGNKAIKAGLYIVRNPVYLIAGILFFIFLWYIGFQYYTYVATGVEDLIAKGVNKIWVKH